MNFAFPHVIKIIGFLSVSDFNLLIVSFIIPIVAVITPLTIEDLVDWPTIPSYY